MEECRITLTPPCFGFVLMRFSPNMFMSIDADELERWLDFFIDTATYRICSRENYDRGLPLSVLSCKGRGMFRDRLSALRIANIFEPHHYRHLTSALRICAVVGDRVTSESNFEVIRTMADGSMSIYACGRTIDVLAVQGNTMKLAERTVILDSRQIDTLSVIPL